MGCRQATHWRNALLASLVVVSVVVSSVEAHNAIPGEVLYRVNCGGPSFTDHDGKVWSADAFFNTGLKFSTSSVIASTSDPGLYQTERYDSAPMPEMEYKFPIAVSGRYSVYLHFAETYAKTSLPGARVFNIEIEGALVATNFDIRAEVPYETALVKKYTVDVRDDMLSIRFLHVKENPKINAIAISLEQQLSFLSVLPASVIFDDVTVGAASNIQTVRIRNDESGDRVLTSLSLDSAEFSLETSVSLPLTIIPSQIVNLNLRFTPSSGGAKSANLIAQFESGAEELAIALSGSGIPSFQFEGTIVHRINAGATSTYTDSLGNSWTSDMYFSAGAKSFSVTSAIQSTVDDPLFQSERYGNNGAPLVYTIPVPQPGSYLVHLFFAEIYYTEAGKRAFHVDLQGVRVLTAFDIVKNTTSGFRAVVTSFPTSVADASISLVLTAVKNNAKISAIAISLLDLPSTTASPTPVATASPTPMEPGSPTPVATPSVNTSPSPSPITGTPPSVALFRVNCGGPQYVDSQGNTWTVDTSLVNTGKTYATKSAIAGTSDDALYQTHRWDASASPELKYTFPVGTSPIPLRVRLHFAEIYGKTAVVGARVFSIKMEDAFVVQNLDVFAIGGTIATAVIREYSVTVTDGSLNIEFIHANDNPMISAIEIFPGVSLDPDSVSVDFGHNDPGVITPARTVTWTNTGSATAQISGFRLRPLTGPGTVWNAVYNGQSCVGGVTEVTICPQSITVEPGASISVGFVFSPAEVTSYAAEFTFEGVGSPVIDLTGEGYLGAGDPFLHVVIVSKEVAIDYDGNGVESFELIGRDSHTHELGQTLIRFEWSENDVIFSTEQDTVAILPVGTHTVSLTIIDSNTPPRVLTGSITLQVRPPTQVPGTLIQHFPASEAVQQYLENLPLNAEYAQRGTLFKLEDSGGSIGNSPVQPPVVVQLLGFFNLETAGSYSFVLTGGSDHRILVNGVLFGPASINLPAGLHLVEVRVAILALTNLPVELKYSVNGGTLQSIPAAQISHDETTILPVINSIDPNIGFPQGGYTVTIQGIGFENLGDVSVLWGTTTISGAQLSLTDTALTFVAPVGASGTTIEVTVINGLGSSGAKPFSYSANSAVPIKFSVSQILSGITSPTRATWGPDHRLYVASITGLIKAYTLDDNYNVIATQTITTLTTNTNNNILGIAVNPFDDSDEVKLFVAHAELFATGGACFTGPLPYSGEVTMLTGPDFDTPEVLVNRLAGFNHDHGVNGMDFDRHGDLLVSVGGNTNAGIVGCKLGGAPEGPFTAAIIKVGITNPHRDLDVDYINPLTCEINNDQVFGETVIPRPGLSVSVWAPGFRNSLALTFTTKKQVYATDNGHNSGFGAISTSATTQATEYNDPDTVQLVDYGRYYGHPNRGRGRFNEIENKFFGSGAAPVPGSYAGDLVTFSPSTNGILEYRSSAFGSNMLGNIIVQKWNGATFRIAVNSAGGYVNHFTFMTNMPCLDILQGPGGAIIGVDYSGGKLYKAIPDDVSVGASLKVFDIHPWRAPSGRSFVIGGLNFGALETTTVTIGGAAATVTSVSPNRIKGLIPTPLANVPTGKLVDVIVNTGTFSYNLAQSFMFLRPNGGSSPTAKVDVIINVPNTNNIITASTYTANSYKIVNQAGSGQKITRVRIDISKAIFRDMVFDPYGTGGDTVAKQFTPNSGATETGYSSVTYFNPHDGGFDVLEITFTDFNPGETFSFSIDNDPTSVKGTAAPGPGESASVSGLELSGSEFFVEFDDDSILTGEVFAYSNVGSKNTLKPIYPPLVLISSPAIPCTTGTLTAENQEIVITGPPGTNVLLLHVEAAKFLPAGGGFEVDQYEANTALSQAIVPATIGTSGQVSLPIVLKRTDALHGGYNIFSAVAVDTEGHYGYKSQTMVMYYNP